MKQYKIVKHHVSPDEFLFRVYKRECFFFWELKTTYQHLSSAERDIHNAIQKSKQKELDKAATPKDQVIMYL